MLEFSTVKEWKKIFGKDYEDAVFELVDTHHLFQISDNKVYFSVGLYDTFDDQMDLWSVDPDMVDDRVQLAMVFSDIELNPDVLTNLIDFTEDKLGYSPVDNTGGFTIKISDLRLYYGEEAFDREMENLFPGHTKWWENKE